MADGFRSPVLIDTSAPVTQEKERKKKSERERESWAPETQKGGNEIEPHHLILGTHTHTSTHSHTSRHVERERLKRERNT